jgi:hypothetical protein
MALAAALLAGLGVAMGLRSILRRGDGHGSRRFIAGMLAASGFAACAAWVFIAVMRIAAGTVTGTGSGAVAGTAALSESFAILIAIYSGIGFLAGFAAGMFPLAAGVPLILVSGLATALAVMSLAPWVLWVDGQEAASVSTFPVTETETTCVLSTVEADGDRRKSTLALAPGPIGLEFSIIRIKGPFTAAFGETRYRLAAVLAGSSRAELLAENAMDAILRRNWILARVLGFKIASFQTELFEPSDFASAVYTLHGDGTIGKAEE